MSTNTTTKTHIIALKTELRMKEALEYMSKKRMLKTSVFIKQILLGEILKEIENGDLKLKKIFEEDNESSLFE